MAAPWTVMGVVNVTPDSFSDGGLWLDADRAISHGIELAAEGAAVMLNGFGEAKDIERQRAAQFAARSGSSLMSAASQGSL